MSEVRKNQREIRTTVIVDNPELAQKLERIRQELGWDEEKMFRRGRTLLLMVFKIWKEGGRLGSIQIDLDEFFK